MNDLDNLDNLNELDYFADSSSDEDDVMDIPPSKPNKQQNKTRFKVYYKWFIRGVTIISLIGIVWLSSYSNDSMIVYLL